MAGWPWLDVLRSRFPRGSARCRRTVTTARSERSSSQRLGLMEVAMEPKPGMNWCFLGK